MTLDPGAMARLLEITGGDRGFVEELVDTFVEDARAQIEALRAAEAAGDVAAVVRPAHSLKSNAQNVGATVLGDLCRALEADARSGDVSDMAARIDAIETELGAVTDVLLAERAGG
jgi:HPt (histidine-containing phosphotransfer) domain-containing protein